MRVVSGKYKHKNLLGFNINGTRPTMDRVKESMFASVQNKVKNSICLDLFAGSGSLGIEALSNGANRCYFVDNGKEAFRILKQNINRLDKEEGIYLYNIEYQKALDFFYQEKIKFDLIFLDPPYQFNYINQVLDLIIKYDLLDDDGYIVCEYEQEKIDNIYLKCIKEKHYGSKNIKIIEKI